MLVGHPVTLGLFGKDAAGAAKGYTGDRCCGSSTTSIQYFSILITLVSAVVMVAVSLYCQPGLPEDQELTLDRHRSDRAKTWPA